jgi:hypothetical protein
MPLCNRNQFWQLLGQDLSPLLDAPMNRAGLPIGINGEVAASGIRPNVGWFGLSTSELNHPLTAKNVVFRG